MISPLGVISTVAGTGQPGVSPDGTVAVEAELDRPSGVYFHEATRNLYIADSYNSQVKRVRVPASR
jgi:hypothetical protein